MRWLLCVLLALVSASMAIPTAMIASNDRGTLGLVAGTLLALTTTLLFFRIFHVV